MRIFGLSRLLLIAVCFLAVWSVINISNVDLLFHQIPLFPKNEVFTRTIIVEPILYVIIFLATLYFFILIAVFAHRSLLKAQPLKAKKANDKSAKSNIFAKVVLSKPVRKIVYLLYSRLMSIAVVFSVGAALLVLNMKVMALQDMQVLWLARLGTIIPILLVVFLGFRWHLTLSIGGISAFFQRSIFISLSSVLALIIIFSTKTREDILGQTADLINFESRICASMNPLLPDEFRISCGSDISDISEFTFSLVNNALAKIEKPQMTKYMIIRGGKLSDSEREKFRRFNPRVYNGLNLANSTLSDLDLSGSLFKGVSFKGADLSGSNFSGSEFICHRIANFKFAVLNDYFETCPNFDYGNLQSARFDGANMKRATFRRAKLTNASFNFTTLDLIDATGANMQEASFFGASMAGASLQGASLMNSQLSSANLEFARLRGVDFTGADLRGARLYRASVDGALFQEVDVWRSDAAESELREAYIGTFYVRPSKLSDLKKIEEQVQNVAISDEKIVAAFIKLTPDYMSSAQESSLHRLWSIANYSDRVTQTPVSKVRLSSVINIICNDSDELFAQGLLDQKSFSDDQKSQIKDIISSAQKSDKSTCQPFTNS